MNNIYVKFMIRLVIVLFVILGCQIAGQAQSPRKILTLGDAVALARGQSQASLLAETQKENRFWQWRTHRSNYLPQLGLSGTLPDFNRSFTPVTQPDGTTEFQPVSINNSDVRLSISQSIGLTGARVFASTQVNRFDDFDNDVTRYSGNPIFIVYCSRYLVLIHLDGTDRLSPCYMMNRKKAMLKN